LPLAALYGPKGLYPISFRSHSSMASGWAAELDELCISGSEKTI
jgi:hypothetical protein